MLLVLLLVSVSSQTLLTGPKPKIQEALRLMAAVNDDVSVELTDHNFEEQTQAASGASTGDWFVFFYNPACQKCASVAQDWKSFAELVRDQKIRTNIGRMNIIANAKTARRLGIYSTPTFLYFKDGHYYNFTAHPGPQNLEAVVKQQDYLQFRKTSVPAELSYLVDWYVFLRWWVIELKAEVAGLVFVILFFSFVYYRTRQFEAEAKLNKQKKE